MSLRVYFRPITSTRTLFYMYRKHLHFRVQHTDSHTFYSLSYYSFVVCIFMVYVWYLFYPSI